MVDILKMTDERLKDRIQRLQTGESIAAFAMMASGAGFLFGSLASLGMAILCFFLMTLSVACGVKTVFSRRDCQEEYKRRHPPQAQVIRRADAGPEPAALVPKAAKDFNPAAATVLEEDMKPMTPLRLKKRAMEFIHD